MLDIPYWTPENPGNRYPKPSSSWTRPEYTNESYIQDVSFLRLKFVTLGYTVPQRVLSRFNISRLRIYASAQNPYLYTKFTGLDPEGAQGLESPSATTIMGGVNVTF